jgi:hypothetical protein
MQELKPVNNAPMPKPPESVPDFEALARKVAAYAEKILARLNHMPIQAKEIKDILDAEAHALRETPFWASRYGMKLQVHKRQFSLDDTANTLTEYYGIEDTQELEDVREELRGYLKRDNEYQHGGPSSERSR